MHNIDVYNMKGEVIETLELSDYVFGVGEERNLSSVIHNVAYCQITRMKRKTGCTKTRSEVRGGGRKPYKQKGTGRARQGSTRSPQWRGGGVVFGPRPWAEEQKNVRIPKKARRLAIRAVLSSKVANGQMMVMDELKFDNIKTKNMIEVFKNLKIDCSAVVMLQEQDKIVFMSTKNIPNVKVLTTGNINMIDLLKYDKLIVTKEVVKRIEEVYA